MKDFLHLLNLINIFFKARLDTLLTEYTNSKLLSFLIFFLPWKIFSAKEPRGERIKKALEEAGPVFIKFGQLISTRPDVVPSDIARSLQSLQDNLPPFSSKDAIEIIEKELGDNENNIFDDFEELIYKGHPIGRNILGTKKTLENFTSKNTIAYHRKHYHTNEIILSSVGNIDFNKLIKIAEKYLAPIPNRSRAKYAY